MSDIRTLNRVLGILYGNISDLDGMKGDGKRVYPLEKWKKENRELLEVYPEIEDIDFRSRRQIINVCQKMKKILERHDLYDSEEIYRGFIESFLPGTMGNGSVRNIVNFGMNNLSDDSYDFENIIREGRILLTEKGNAKGFIKFYASCCDAALEDSQNTPLFSDEHYIKRFIRRLFHTLFNEDSVDIVYQKKSRQYEVFKDGQMIMIIAVSKNKDKADLIFCKREGVRMTDAEKRILMEGESYCRTRKPLRSYQGICAVLSGSATLVKRILKSRKKQKQGSSAYQKREISRKSRHKVQKSDKESPLDQEFF